MKRIMFVDENKVVNYAGGIEKVLCNFANEFVTRGYYISIVCMDKEYGKPLYKLDDEVNFINLYYDESNGAKDFAGYKWFLKKIEKELLRTFAGADMKIGKYHIKDPKQEYYFNIFITRLRLVIEREKPDLLISTGANSAWLIQMALGGRNIPIIAMSHTDPIHFWPEMTSKQINAWKKCVYVQVLLPIFAKFLKDKGIDSVISIPNVVPQIPDNKIRNLSNRYCTITMIGRIEKNAKRQHLLIEAFSLISAKYPNWSVHIYGAVGNKSYKKELDALINKKQLQGRVFFEGVTDKVFEVLQKTDIFVFPSKYEGFGLALTEAMSAGVPVVGCKDCPAVSDIIDDNISGRLCKSTPTSMAEVLQELINNTSLMRKLGRNAHQEMKKYDQHIIWGKWEKVFHEIFSR